MLPIQRLSLVLLALPAAGCAQSFRTVEDAHAQGEGTSRTYALPVHDVYDAARAVLRCEGASYVGDGERGGELLASWDPTLGFRGYFGVFLEQDDEDHTRVTAVSQGSGAAQIILPLREGTFHDRLAARVRTGQLNGC
jgi:hypothetical protein